MKTEFAKVKFLKDGYLMVEQDARPGFITFINQDTLRRVELLTQGGNSEEVSTLRVISPGQFDDMSSDSFVGIWVNSVPQALSFAGPRKDEGPLYRFTRPDGTRFFVHLSDDNLAAMHSKFNTCERYNRGVGFTPIEP